MSKAKVKYFTKLDVQWGYNNIRIWEGDKWKMDFWMNQDLFETLVMFISLTNSCEGYTTPYNESPFPGALPAMMATTTT